MRRYLPLVALTTGVVMVLPAVIVTAITPRGGPLWLAASGLSAVALSMALAAAGAALWKRQPHSRDIVFSDLLLWGWLRRCWTERRLSQARELYDAARKAGPSVSIELVTGLSRLLESRDAYTHGHGQRVARHAAQIARAMHLSSVEVARIRTAAAIHDVGKLYTPREILNNPGRLSDAEYEVAKRHAPWGARMLAEVGDPEIAAMVGHHHERIDGKGYPDGLAGEDIPVGARIIAVADTYDAITSSRAYRAACPHKRALDVLSTEAGAQLDGDAVAAFRGTYSARRSIAWGALAAALPQRLIAALQAASHSLGGSGVAAILPGVGAAGLIALSPGLHHNALALKGVQPTSGVSVSQPATTAAGSPVAARRGGSVAGGQRAPAGRRHSGTTVRHSPAPPRARNTTGSTRQSSGASGRESGGGGATSSPSPKLPVTPPEVTVVPPVTPPPVTPPVQTPIVPEVKLPPVQVPSVPGIGVTPPAAGVKLTIPGVKLPPLGVKLPIPG
jgi:hypothetical protein